MVMKLRIFLLGAISLLFTFVCSAQFTLENAVMAEGSDPNPPYFNNEKYIFSYTELAASVVILKDLGPNELTVYHEWYRRNDLNNPIWVFEHPIGCCWGLYISVSNRIGSDPDIGFGDFTLKFRIGVTNSGNYPVVATKNFSIQPPVCEASSAPYALVNGHTWLDLQWDDPIGVDGDYYTIYQREKGGSVWTPAQSFSDCIDPQILIFGPKLDGSTYGLKPCTNYEIKILKECKTGGTAESPVSTIPTGECGNDYFTTVPLRYAAGKRACSIIESITLANLFDYNGICEGSIVDPEHGYEFFTQDTARLERGKDYVFDLTTNGRAGTHHAGGWIDYDGNTFFEVNKNERVFSGQQTLSSDCSTWSASFTISIPANAPTGFRRMRIVSSYNTAAQPHAGTMNSGGRVEDIVVEIKDSGPVFLAPTLAAVTGGTFTMGCTDEVKPCANFENPPHSVTLPDFQIGRYEITQAEWQSLMGNNPSSFSNCPNCPVERVSWYDAAVYCNRLSEKLGLKPCYYADASYKQVYGKSGSNWNMPNTGPVFWKKCADGYRLPTEAEWEFVARGGSLDATPKTPYPGSSNVGGVAWYKNNANSKTNPVGQKQANELGVYDMSGNVWEWCYDWYDPNYYAASNCCIPTGPANGTIKTTRGGSWFDDETSMRVSHRNGDFTNAPERRVDTNRGFRVVRGGGGDSLALVRLYQSTNGPSWVNKWNLSDPVSKWYGVSLDLDGCVDTIALGGNGLAGVLPQQIGNFAHLRLLRLPTNFITGTIPEETARLTELQELNLSQNKNLSGSIPASLGNLSQLKALYLNECNFSAAIPAELGQLSNLEILNLSKNKLNSSSSLNVGAWSKLKECFWNENQFSGPLPTGFTGLPQLKHLNLSINNFDGSIPAAYGNMSAIDSLFLNNNQLSGCLNANLKKLCAAKRVSIAANTGLATQDWAKFCSQDEGLCAPSKCNVKIDSSALAELYKATGGMTTWAKQDNWLQPGKKIGEWYGIKTTTEGCVQCIGLDGDADPCNAVGGLPGNGLIGPIPKEIGNFTELEVLNLFGNQLSGSMPKELGLLSKLKVMVLDRNVLTGSIPLELGNLTQLVSIGIGANQIGGTIPASLANAKSLQYLFFQDNKNISGTIPGELFSLPELRGLYLQNNNLSGAVPVQILQAKKLESFFIAKNKITDLPNISSLPFVPDGPIPAYNGLRIADNKLTFRHILPNITILNQFINNPPQTRYAPQDSIFSDTTIIKNANETFVVDLGIDAAVTGNRYQWFKGSSSSGQPLLTTNQREFKNVQPSDAGTYYVQVTNPAAPLLTLRSRAIRIQVIPDPGACNPKNDSLELVKLYDATGGANWTNKWDLTKPMKTWDGVTITGSCVTGLFLSKKGLAGNLPDLNLPKLEELHCDSNQLVGNIPDFKGLPNLKVFVCNYNNFSGSIPDFKNLPNLQGFYCAYNKLTGNIPDFSNLPNLQVFDCPVNKLSGSIPDFKNLPNLLGFYCWDNDLTGKIPDFSNLPNLIRFSCIANELSGSIPNFTKLPNLQVVNCSANRLSGEVPDFAKCPKLAYLALLANRFTFEDILPSKNKIDASVSTNCMPDLCDYLYENQDSVFHDTLLVRNAGQNLDFSLDFDEAVTTNKYKWYKDGIEQPNQDQAGNNNLIIPGLQPVHAGKWTVKVTNPLAPELILYSRTIRLQVGCTGALAPVIQGPSNLCNGSATLTVNGSYQSWKWSGSITQQTSSVMVNAPGTYTVTTTDANGCTATASITVGATVALPTAKIEGSGAICGTQAAVLNAGSAGITAYAWSTGSTGSAISVLNVGTYTVTVKNSAGCTATTQITTQAFPAPQVNIALLVAICDGNPAKMQVNQNYPKYEWSGGQNTKQISPTTPGIYTVTITDANTCTATATRNVIIGPKITVDLGADIGRCTLPGAGIKLDAGPADAYSWSTGSNLNVITVKQFGEYAVTVTNAAGCTDSDTVRVYLKDAVKVQIDTFLCPGITLKYCGKSITQPGIYNDCKFTTIEGCDSILILKVAQFDSSLLTAEADVFNMPFDPKTVEISVLDNDVVPDKYSLEIAQGPTTGTVTVLPDGRLRYTPVISAQGKDSLLYVLCPEGGCPALCEQAWLTIRFQTGDLETIKKRISNFITPDDDGQNDFFDPLKHLTDNEIFPDPGSEKLFVINRWGEVIYRSDDAYQAWNGKKHGDPVPKATYYFTFEFKVGGEIEWIKGAINVIR